MYEGSTWMRTGSIGYSWANLWRKDANTHGLYSVSNTPYMSGRCSWSHLRRKDAKTNRRTNIGTCAFSRQTAPLADNGAATSWLGLIALCQLAANDFTLGRMRKVNLSPDSWRPAITQIHWRITISLLKRKYKMHMQPPRQCWTWMLWTPCLCVEICCACFQTINYIRDVCTCWACECESENQKTTENFQQAKSPNNYWYVFGKVFEGWDCSVDAQVDVFGDLEGLSH